MIFKVANATGFLSNVHVSGCVSHVVRDPDQWLKTHQKDPKRHAQKDQTLRTYMTI